MDIPFRNPDAQPSAFMTDDRDDNAPVTGFQSEYKGDDNLL